MHVTHAHTPTQTYMHIFQPILRKHIEINKDPKAAAAAAAAAAAEAQKRAAAAPPGPPKISEKSIEIGTIQ
jgi:hypothetical protein